MSPSPELPQLNCRLEPAENPIAVGETLSYTVVNAGEGAVMFGRDEALSWKTDDGWQQLPLGGWVAAVGLIVEPGQRSKPMLVEVSQHLALGRYRLTKRVNRGHIPQPDSITASCEFDVVMLRDERPNDGSRLQTQTRFP